MDETHIDAHHCLLIGPSDREHAQLRQAFKDSGWRVTKDYGTAPTEGADAYNLIFVFDVVATPTDELRTRKRADAIVAGIVSGPTPPTADVTVNDTLFCRGPGLTEHLRSAGIAVHSLPKGPAWADKCVEILERHLKSPRHTYSPVDWSRISSDYALISEAQVTEDMVKAWQSEEIPNRQRALVQAELAEMYQGRAPKVYTVLVDALRPYATEGLRVLEESAARAATTRKSWSICSMRPRVTGRRLFRAPDPDGPLGSPRTRFAVADGARLPFPGPTVRCLDIVRHPAAHTKFPGSHFGDGPRGRSNRRRSPHANLPPSADTI